jgi:hypothetical protein
VASDCSLHQENFMNTNANLWSKYLPVIRLLMKRSLSTEQQVFALNIPDFERAVRSRRSGCKFSFELTNGEATNVVADHPLASSLAVILRDDGITKELMKTRSFQLTLNPKYELTIKQIHGFNKPESAAQEEGNS